MRDHNRNKSRFGGRDSYGDRDSRRRDFGRNSERKEFHTVICDSCGVQCKVPFKPTSNKPVYCSDCFEEKGNSRSESNSSSNSSELKEISRKLDRIIYLLEDV